MPDLIRSTFISDNVVKVATSKDTMYVVGEDGKSIIEAHILQSIQATGTIPEGYAVDFHFDPASVVATLAKKNITTVEQLPDGLLDKLKATINGVDNVTIAPAFIVENKRNALKEVAGRDA